MEVKERKFTNQQDVACLHEWICFNLDFAKTIQSAGSSLILQVSCEMVGFVARTRFRSSGRKQLKK